MKKFTEHEIIIALFVVAILLFVTVSGCSDRSDSDPSKPPLPVEMRTNDQTDRILWGYYEMHIDPVAGEVNITPLRQICMHLNGLQHLETATTTLVTIEGPPQFNGEKLLVDIGIKHPYTQQIYAAFDVRGILISRGSVDFSGNYILPGQDNFRLLNPDGYTRFWNPTEFTGSGYQDGILGIPHSIGDFNATVNGYKYFATGLSADEEFASFLSPLRGAFTPGAKNVRHYEIKIGDAGIVFNYAVDASWAMPESIPPVIPDDFDLNEANSKEAWKIVPTFENRLSPGGGECHVSIDVYDWQGMSTIHGVHLHAPDIFKGTIKLFGPVDKGDHFTYSTVFINELEASGGDFPLLIRVTDTEAGTNPYLEAFYLEFIPINDVVITLDEDTVYKTPGTDYTFTWDSYELSTTAPPVDYKDLDGPWDFAAIPFPNTDHRTIFAPDAYEVSQFVYDFPADVEYFFRESESGNPVFRAEEHNEASGGLNLYGLHAKEYFGGSIVFPTPVELQFPMDRNTDYTVEKVIIIIPSTLVIRLEFHTKVIGQGWAKVSLDGGTWHNCLLVRNAVKMSTDGSMGEGWMATLLGIEWIADNGISVAGVVSTNIKDGAINFNEDTYEIFGEANFTGLQEITTF